MNNYTRSTSQNSLFKEIINKQDNLADFFKSNQWSSLTLAEKQTSIEDVFHIKNWTLLKPEHRLMLFQEFENVLSARNGRTPCIVNITESSLLDKAAGDAKYILFKNEYLLDGFLTAPFLDFKMQRAFQGRYTMKNLNVDLLFVFLHERVHTFQHQKYAKYQKDDKEDGECILNMVKIGDNMSNFIDPYSSFQNAILFNYQPSEYYANKYARESLNIIFIRLTNEFGSDYTYREWVKERGNSEAELLMSYSQIVGKYFTPVQIKSILIRDMIARTAISYNQTNSEVCSELKLDDDDYKMSRLSL